MERIGVRDADVAGVIRCERVDVLVFPEVQLDRAAREDHIAVGLGRLATRFEAEPLVECDRLVQVAAREDGNRVIVH
jgi:hypothetical protein